MKSRNPNDALFRLIKSMNQGEKRFFTLLSGHHGKSEDKIYLKLFYAIEKQDTYDEAALKKDFKTQGSQFIEAKKYLYTLVLNTLVQHYRLSNEKDLYNRLVEIEMLFAKGLYDLYELILYKIRQVAEEKNDFLMVLETFKREKRLHILSSNFYTPVQMQKIREQERYFTELYDEVEGYLQLSNEIVYYGSAFKKSILKNLKALAEQPLFKDTSKPRSLMAKWLLHNLRGICYLFLADYASAFIDHTKSLQLSESNPFFQKNNPTFAFTTFRNYIVNCIQVKKYNLALDAIVKYKAFLVHYPELMKRKLVGLFTEELIIYKDTHRKNEADSLIKEVESKLNKNELLPNDEARLLFYLNAGFSCLEFEEYHSSLKWGNAILNFQGAERTSFRYYYNARILQLFSLFSLKSNELLAYRVKSFYKMMLKRGPVNPVDKAILHFFNTFLKGKYTEEKKGISSLIREFKSSLEKAIKNSPKEELLVSYPDFTGWLTLMGRKSDF